MQTSTSRDHAQLAYYRHHDVTSCGKNAGPVVLLFVKCHWSVCRWYNTLIQANRATVATESTTWHQWRSQRGEGTEMMLKFDP